jgi:nicotinamidase-related amidase
VRSVLVTQCVQNDFVRPLAPGEPLPNLVHVGRLEAERLCGPAGAPASFLREAHSLPPDRLAIVHVVDRHDPVHDADHFAQFRPHCVAGSPGAELVPPIDVLARARPATHLVEAGDLNDFEDSALPATLAAVLAEGDREEVRVAVVGVWTDAKVAFLLYDLRTRLGVCRLATGSALTASRSLDAHFRALEGLHSTLDVEVLHSPGALLDWLAPDRAIAAPPRGDVRLAFTAAASAPRWWNSDDIVERDALLGQLGEGERVALVPLGGGFSGAQVFLARTPGRPASILKVGARDEIARERFGNERVARTLGDVVPRLHAWREGSRLAGMRLELAESADPDASAPATFQHVARADASSEATDVLAAALEDALGAALGRFYRTAEKDNADLLEVYGFTDRRGHVPFGASAVAHANAVAQESGCADARALLAGSGLDGPLMAPAEFYGSWLPGRTLTREVYASLVHGDLNLANILLSRRAAEWRPARLWIIDFARLARLPSLTDFAKVENDLAYILLAVDDDAAFARGLALQEARLGTATLEVELAPLATTEVERRHARLVAALRRVAARVDPRGAEAMADYRLALLRYAAHTLGFDEPSLRQRRLALFACARLAGLVAAA